MEKLVSPACQFVAIYISRGFGARLHNINISARVVSVFAGGCARDCGYVLAQSVSPPFIEIMLLKSCQLSYLHLFLARIQFAR